MAACDTSPAIEISRLHYLIARVRGDLSPAGTDCGRQQYTAWTLDDLRDGIQLPGFAVIFPSFSSVRSNSASAYPTPTSLGTAFPPSNRSPARASSHVPQEQHVFNEYLEAIRRGFAVHRECNRYAFTAYNEMQVDQLLNEFQGSMTDNEPLDEVRTCEAFSVGVISATFNRVEIPAKVGDLFYQVASEGLGVWVSNQPLAAMRCCGLLGLANLFQKATVSLLYFDLALAIANSLWHNLSVKTLDASRADHIEFHSLWQSVVFGRAWLQSTIGVCTLDDQLWLPAITTKSNYGIEIDTATQMQVSLPTELAHIAVIASKGMRVLAACTTPGVLLPAIRTLAHRISGWYNGLPQIAKAHQLSQTPWDGPKVCLAYIHLNHLGAITLMFRRTLSVYKLKTGGQMHTFKLAERSQLDSIFTDGTVAAKQSAQILRVFLDEQAGIRHCWAIIHMSFVSAVILLYCTSQMQLHEYPENEWSPFLDLVGNDMAILDYCQELDPVASALRNTLSQYMQFLRMPTCAPKRAADQPRPRTKLQPSPSTKAKGDEHAHNLVDTLLTIPKGRAGPAQTSIDLLKLVCQPFSDAAGPSSSNSNGYHVPHVLGKWPQQQQRSPRNIFEAGATLEMAIPYGWQQCQSSVGFAENSRNLAVTMAQQEEMLRAGV